MAPSLIAQRRTHNLLLLQKLLNLKEGTSPFTLLLDDLEARGGSSIVFGEFVRRAKLIRSKVTFISFQALRRPQYADVFLRATCNNLSAIQAELSSHNAAARSEAGPTQHQRSLILIDTLNPLAASRPNELPSFLSSLLASRASVLAIYHTDIVLPRPLIEDEYAPNSLITLQYLATAILRVSSLSQAIARKKARDRSLQEPEWGLSERQEGVLIGLCVSRASDVVLEMEVRRKSGRGVKETFVMSRSSSTSKQAAGRRKAADLLLCLLEDHPLYSETAEIGMDVRSGTDGGENQVETTFSLGLTEKQRKDREGIVLPYFDAQEGGGEGGRILYEMGREDDFDEEEDEI